MQDYNKQPAEYGNRPNTPQPQELNTVGQNKTPVQLTFTEQNQKRSASTVNPKPKTDPKKLLSAVMAIVVTLSLGTAVATGGDLSPWEGIVVELAEFGANSTEIFYHLNLTLPNQSQIFASLTNEHTNRQTPLTDGANGGVFDGLVAGQKYTFAVIGKSGISQKTFLSKQITMPHPITDSYATLQSLVPDGNSVSFVLQVDSQTPLQAQLVGQTYDQKQNLSNLTGANQGVFSGLVEGGQYTLQVIGDDLFGNSQIVYSYPFTMPAMLADSAVSLELSADGNAIYYYVQVNTDQPLQIALQGEDGTTQSARLNSGVNEGGFDNLTPGVTYTVEVLWQVLLAQVPVATQQVYLPHPLDFAQVTLSSIGADSNAIYAEMDVSSEVQLRAVLTNLSNDTTQNFNLADGYNSLEFTNLTYQQTYRLDVIGQGYADVQSVFSRYLVLPELAETDVMAQLLQYTMQGSTFSYNLSVVGAGTVQVTLSGQNYNQQRDITNLDGGDNLGEFTNLVDGQTYTLTVSGTGASDQPQTFFTYQFTYNGGQL